MLLIPFPPFPISHERGRHVPNEEKLPPTHSTPIPRVNACDLHMQFDTDSASYSGEPYAPCHQSGFIPEGNPYHALLSSHAHYPSWLSHASSTTFLSNFLFTNLFPSILLTCHTISDHSNNLIYTFPHIE